MLRKILEIGSCFDCPFYETYGAEGSCRKVGRRLRSRFGSIPKDCPLEDAPKEQKRKNP